MISKLIKSADWKAEKHVPAIMVHWLWEREVKVIV